MNETEIVNDYANAEDVMRLVGIGRTSAYAVIRELNRELKEKGYLVFSGKVPREYLLKRCGLVKKG